MIKYTDQIIIENVPTFNNANANMQERFINLIDVLYDNKIQIIIADPIGSVVADAVNTGNYKYEGGSWLVEGIGEDYIPDNLNLDIIDEGIYVSDKDAFARVDELLRK